MATSKRRTMVLTQSSMLAVLHLGYLFLTNDYRIFMIHDFLWAIHMARCPESHAFQRNFEG
jgi:hypothetical protein